MDYYFSDFIQSKYKILLELAKRRYLFVSYNEAMMTNQEFIILRHDIDFSPQRALSLAQIEQRLKIKTTYCVQLGSIFYNIFEKDIKRILLNIRELGHDIGLHFDAAIYNIKNRGQMEKYIRHEKKILDKLLGCKIKVVSFHNPVSMLLNVHNFKIDGLINTYASFFINNLKYISDSNGYWRHERLRYVLTAGSYRRLHILIHPGWWQKKVMTPWERIQRCVDGRREFVLHQYRTQLHKAGRKNVGYASDNIWR